MADEDRIFESAGNVDEVQSLLSRGRADELSFTEIDKEPEGDAHQKKDRVGESLEEPRFRELKKTSADKERSRELDFIMDIPLEISVEIGRARMLIGDMLKLGQGSVIELNRLSGEPVDIFVNKKLIARGEVVVAGEKFGVRIIDIISPSERVKRLG
jgi:flagellar motor switch protein FliN/FliY